MNSTVEQEARPVYTGLPANWLDDIIATHLIDASALRDDDFDRFYQARDAEAIEGANHQFHRLNTFAGLMKSLMP